MHAMQGDAEIAGHTTDVAGTITVQVHVLKKLTMDGPLILPVKEDLPFLAQPLTPKERLAATEVIKRWGMDAIEESMPISVVGTGADMNKATQNGCARALRRSYSRSRWFSSLLCSVPAAVSSAPLPSSTRPSPKSRTVQPSPEPSTLVAHLASCTSPSACPFPGSKRPA